MENYTRLIELELGDGSPKEMYDFLKKIKNSVIVKPVKIKNLDNYESEISINIKEFTVNDAYLKLLEFRKHQGFISFNIINDKSGLLNECVTDITYKFPNNIKGNIESIKFLNNQKKSRDLMDYGRFQIIEISTVIKNK